MKDETSASARPPFPVSGSHLAAILSGEVRLDKEVLLKRTNPHRSLKMSKDKISIFYNLFIL